MNQSRQLSIGQSENYELAKTNLAKAKLAIELDLPDSTSMLEQTETESQHFDQLITKGLGQIQEAAADC